MASYVASDKITVFPTTRRGSVQQDARLFTEKSVAGIINQLVDLDSFIITSKDDVGLDKPFEFNIRGYYFKVQRLRDITNLFNESTSLTIYAVIYLDEGNNYTELMGQDDSMGGTNNTVYKGVTFNNTPITGTNVFSLFLLSRSSSSSTVWEVPEESRYKFDKESLDIDIDGGII